MTGLLIVRLERHTISFPAKGFGRRLRGLREFRSGHEHAGDTRELKHGEDGLGSSHHSERASRGLELLEVFHQHAYARRADVIHLREVEVNLMLSGADGGLDGAANAV